MPTYSKEDPFKDSKTVRVMRMDSARTTTRPLSPFESLRGGVTATVKEYKVERDKDGKRIKFLNKDGTTAHGPLRAKEGK